MNRLKYIIIIILFSIFFNNNQISFADNNIEYVKLNFDMKVKFFKSEKIKKEGQNECYENLIAINEFNDTLILVYNNNLLNLNNFSKIDFNKTYNLKLRYLTEFPKCDTNKNKKEINDIDDYSFFYSKKSDEDIFVVFTPKKRLHDDSGLIWYYTSDLLKNGFMIPDSCIVGNSPK